MLDKAVGTRIRKLREERGMTREELASKAEITTKFLYEVENGKKGLSANNLYKIASTLSSSCDYLLLGVHRAGKKSNYKQLNIEILKDLNEKEREIIVTFLKLLLECIEEKSK